MLARVDAVTDQDPVVVGGRFLTAKLVVIPFGAEQTAFDGKKYYKAMFVPILVDPDTAHTGTGLLARTVVIDGTGSIVEQLVQEKGVQEYGIQKTQGSSLLWL